MRAVGLAGGERQVKVSTRAAVTQCGATRRAEAIQCAVRALFWGFPVTHGVLSRQRNMAFVVIAYQEPLFSWDQYFHNCNIRRR